MNDRSNIAAVDAHAIPHHDAVSLRTGKEFAPAPRAEEHQIGGAGRMLEDASDQQGRLGGVEDLAPEELLQLCVGQVRVASVLMGPEIDRRQARAHLGPLEVMGGEHGHKEQRHHEGGEQGVDDRDHHQGQERRAR